MYSNHINNAKTISITLEVKATVSLLKFVSILYPISTANKNITKAPRECYKKRVSKDIIAIYHNIRSFSHTAITTIEYSANILARLK